MPGDILESFFHPRSIAVIGASATPGKPGYAVVENLARWRYPGAVYPVNPKGGDVLGLKAYTSLTATPDGIDLVVTMAPAEDTLGLIDECARKGVRSVSIVSGGFSETGDAGAALERRVVAAARARGIRLMGPNCIGPVNPGAQLALLFYSLGCVKPGKVAFVAQSGQFCAPVMEWMASAMNVGVSKSVDLGNKCDLDEADVLRYLLNDGETGAAALYIEGVRDGARFLRAAAEFTRVKPAVVFKAGRTAAGSRAAASHTGAVANDDAVFNAAVEQAGLLRAHDLDEFLDLTKALSCLALPPGRRIGIITYSGGVGAMASDAASEAGLEVAALSDVTLEHLRRSMPSARVANPLDLFANYPPQDYSRACLTSLERVLADGNIDCGLLCLMVSRHMWPHDMAVIARVARASRIKPTAAWVIGEKAVVDETASVLEQNGLPVFGSPERAVRALARLAHLGSRNGGQTR